MAKDLSSWAWKYLEGQVEQEPVNYMLMLKMMEGALSSLILVLLSLSAIRN